MIKNISAEELKTKKNENAQFLLIDVREPFERENGHIEGDINIPLSTLCCDNLPEGEYKEIIIYCRSGGRSASACEQLLQENKKLKLYNLEGGFMAYSENSNKKESCCVVKKCCNLSLEQQTYIVIGAILLLSTIAGAILSTLFYVVPGLMGLGLIFAGYRGDCMLTKCIAQLPCNRKRKN